VYAFCPGHPARLSAHRLPRPSKAPGRSLEPLGRAGRASPLRRGGGRSWTS